NITATAAANTRTRRATQLAAVVTNMVDEEIRWSNLISTISPLCRQNLLFLRRIPGTRPGLPFPGTPTGALLQLTTQEIARLVGGWGGFVVPAPQQGVQIPADSNVSLNIIARDDPFDTTDL